MGVGLNDVLRMTVGDARRLARQLTDLAGDSDPADIPMEM
jgi:hypothetical protein